MYSSEEVAKADDYLRTVVDTVHRGGAKSILYIGPVQVPLFNEPFRKAHPDWLRVKPDGSRDENFGNIRSGYADWLCAQLAYVVKTYGADGFWFDGYAPVHLHTLRRRRRKTRFRDFSGGAEIPTTVRSGARSRGTASIWPGTSSTLSTWPIGCGGRFAPRMPRP